MEEPPNDAKALRVLVADDASVMRMLLRTLLGRILACKVTEANDGPTALKLATEQDFDLVLLDVNMPGMTGLAVLEGLRRLPAYKTTPIIIITALGQEKHRDRGLQLGASAYVLKPLREAALARALLEVIPTAFPPPESDAES